MVKSKIFVCVFRCFILFHSGAYLHAKINTFRIRHLGCKLMIFNQWIFPMIDWLCAITSVLILRDLINRFLSMANLSVNWFFWSCGSTSTATVMHWFMFLLVIFFLSFLLSFLALEPNNPPMLNIMEFPFK